jgi:hypothetical protein
VVISAPSASQFAGRVKVVPPVVER